MIVTARTVRVVVALATTIVLGGCAGLLSQIPTSDPLASATPADGLREALRIGTGRAVETLGRPDGFLGNPEVRIGLPSKLRPVDTALRAVGQGALVDDFVTSMNRAAEAAVPLARPVFVDAIREMTFEDAVAILKGDDHEATDYLRAHAGGRLADAFRPIVSERLGAVGATREFDRVVEQVNRLPLMTRPVLDLDAYVTDRALDGLFSKLADEERRIREDPLARTTALLRRFFGDGAAR